MRPAGVFTVDRRSVPRVAHMIWLQGFDALPAKYAPYMEKNRQFCAEHGYALMLWDGAAIEALLADEEPRWLAKYRAYPHVHQRVDVGRYCIAYLFGGVTVDCDAYVLRDPLASPAVRGLLDAQLQRGPGATVISESVGTGLQARVLTMGMHSRLLNNACIITTPRRSELRRFIEWVPTAPPPVLLGGLTDVAAMLSQKVVDIHCTTGPSAFTYWFAEAERRGSVGVTDYDVLEPCGLQGCFTSDKTAIVHEHTSSWLPEWVVHVARWGGNAAAVVVLLVIIVAIKCFLI